VSEPARRGYCSRTCLGYCTLNMLIIDIVLHLTDRCVSPTYGRVHTCPVLNLLIVFVPCVPSPNRPTYMSEHVQSHMFSNSNLIFKSTKRKFKENRSSMISQFQTILTGKNSIPYHTEIAGHVYLKIWVFHQNVLICPTKTGNRHKLQF